MADNRKSAGEQNLLQTDHASISGSQKITVVVANEASENSSLSPQQQLGCFERWLTIWILIAMILGTAIGALVPAIPDALEQATVASIWLPGVILVWLMIYPMMLGIRWNNIREIGHPINWAVQPFLMWTRRAAFPQYGLAVQFFEVIYANILDDDTQKQYIAGAVILGGSPCTAMVFVWSSLHSWR